MPQTGSYSRIRNFVQTANANVMLPSEKSPRQYKTKRSQKRKADEKIQKALLNLNVTAHLWPFPSMRPSVKFHENKAREPF